MSSWPWWPRRPSLGRRPEARWTRSACAYSIVYIGALLRALATPTPRPKQPHLLALTTLRALCAGALRLLEAEGATISSARQPPTVQDPGARPCRALWHTSGPLTSRVSRDMPRTPFGPRTSSGSARRAVSRPYVPLCAGACCFCV